jgi:hypothetical protein
VRRFATIEESSSCAWRKIGLPSNCVWRSPVSSFIRTPVGYECTLLGQATTQGDSAPEARRGERRASCKIRSVIARWRPSVCWRVKRPVSHITADFSCLWPCHGSRSRARMRRWTICLRVGTRLNPLRGLQLKLFQHTRRPFFRPASVLGRNEAWPVFRKL